jgi:hypothetical protein
MNFQKAFEILEIDTNQNLYKDITLDFLKRKYYQLALQYHPDKNTEGINTTEKFQQINEAYEYLRKEINLLERNNPDSESESETFSNEYSSYLSFLSLFIQRLLPGYSSQLTKLIIELIEKIVLGCQKVTFQWFEELDKETSIQIYEFLSQYRKLLSIQPEIIDKVREIILEKCKNDCVYILNPSIDDLLDQNVYKLVIEGEIYFVPLWHINSDILYDKVPNFCENVNGNGNNSTNMLKEEIIVRCIPELPENIWIDEEENINISHIIDSYIPLLERITIDVFIGKKIWQIPIRDLYIRRNQIYVLKGQGITKIKNHLGEELKEMNLDKNISNSCLNKKNIIIHISIV